MHFDPRTKEGDSCALLLKLLYAILAKVTLASVNHLGHAFGRHPFAYGEECAALWRTASTLLSSPNPGAKSYQLVCNGAHCWLGTATEEGRNLQLITRHRRWSHASISS
jgi:hypothetical protein